MERCGVFQRSSSYKLQRLPVSRISAIFQVSPRAPPPRRNSSPHPFWQRRWYLVVRTPLPICRDLTSPPQLTEYPEAPPFAQGAGPETHWVICRFLLFVCILLRRRRWWRRWFYTRPGPRHPFVLTTWPLFPAFPSRRRLRLLGRHLPLPPLALGTHLSP